MPTNQRASTSKWARKTNHIWLFTHIHTRVRTQIEVCGREKKTETTIAVDTMLVSHIISFCIFLNLYLNVPRSFSSSETLTHHHIICSIFVSTYYRSKRERIALASRQVTTLVVAVSSCFVVCQVELQLHTRCETQPTHPHPHTLSFYLSISLSLSLSRK